MYKYRMFDFESFFDKYIEQRIFGEESSKGSISYEQFSKLSFKKSLALSKKKDPNILDKYIEEEVKIQLQPFKDERVYPTSFYEFLDYFVGFKDPTILSLFPSYYSELYSNIEIFKFKINDPLTDSSLIKKPLDDTITLFLNERKSTLEKFVSDDSWVKKFLHPRF